MKALKSQARDYLQFNQSLLQVFDDNSEANYEYKIFETKMELNSTIERIDSLGG